MLYDKLKTFDFVRNRKKFYWFSSTITVLGILALLIFGLNKGVDFKAGTTLDINSAGQPMEKAKVEQIIKDAGFQTATLTIAGTNSDHATARFDKVLTKEEVTKVMSGFTSSYGDKVTKEENTVDTELAKELAQKAIVAVLLASLGIIIYVSIRFEWRFALAAIVALLHDAFIVISLFSLFRFEVNLPFVAAILTIIGYSINDTIVIFDRIRENMRFAKLKNFDDLCKLVDNSIWQTMTRSINTVFTVFVGALCLFIFGSESIKYFSLAMLFGLVSGAYSSVCIASPIWITLKNKSLRNVRTAATAKE